MSEELKKELDEAILAGERALGSLKTAYDNLTSAKNWGIFDMMGGGLIADMVKYSRINSASSYLETAKMDLKKFQTELRDIPDYERLNVDINGFLSFADFFFDGFFVDYMVQSKIRETAEEINKVIHRVECLLEELKNCK